MPFRAWGKPIGTSHRTTLLCLQGEVHAKTSHKAVYLVVVVGYGVPGKPGGSTPPSLSLHPPEAAP